MHLCICPPPSYVTEFAKRSYMCNYKYLKNTILKCSICYISKNVRSSLCAFPHQPIRPFSGWTLQWIATIPQAFL